MQKHGDKNGNRKKHTPVLAKKFLVNRTKNHVIFML